MRDGAIDDTIVQCGTVHANYGRLANSRDRRILDIETRCGWAGKENAPQPHEDNPRAVPDWPCAGPNSTTHRL